MEELFKHPREEKFMEIYKYVLAISQQKKIKISTPYF